jgi:hypothetical protein
MSSFAWIIIIVLLLTILGTTVLVLVTVKYYWGERGRPPLTGEERRRQQEEELRFALSRSNAQRRILSRPASLTFGITRRVVDATRRPWI